MGRFITAELASNVNSCYYDAPTVAITSGKVGLIRYRRLEVISVK